VNPLIKTRNWRHIGEVALTNRNNSEKTTEDGEKTAQVDKVIPIKTILSKKEQKILRAENGSSKTRRRAWNFFAGITDNFVIV